MIGNPTALTLWPKCPPDTQRDYIRSVKKLAAFLGRSIPIVFANVGDPVARGIVARSR
jgi:hypothetical protein